MKDNLTLIPETLAYHQWANERLVKSILKLSDEQYYHPLPAFLENIHHLVFHMLYYERKLFCKITGLQIDKVEKNITREEMMNRLLESATLWSNALHAIDNMLLGDFFDLHHHNNYHRGQIVAAILNFGIIPETLDVFFYRSLT